MTETPIQPTIAEVLATLTGPTTEGWPATAGGPVLAALVHFDGTTLVRVRASFTETATEEELVALWSAVADTAARELAAMAPEPSRSSFVRQVAERPPRTLGTPPVVQAALNAAGGCMASSCDHPSDGCLGFCVGHYGRAARHPLWKTDRPAAVAAAIADTRPIRRYKK